ncbi:hypothetical protein E24_00025 [Faustovirus]|nr:hypothetical protein E24_00025 [Faustovirus]AMN84931.1 hypothetical protein E23_00025 [Faustovirus]
MISSLFLNNNGILFPVSPAVTTKSESICGMLNVQVFERIYTKHQKVGFVSDYAEFIDGDKQYINSGCFWINHGGVANLVKFTDVFVSDGGKFASDLNNVLCDVVPLWMYVSTKMITNGAYYDYKWVYNATQKLLMVELTNGNVQYYETTMDELLQSVDLDRFQDEKYEVKNPAITMNQGDDIYIYRNQCVSIMKFKVVRPHAPLRPIEYVNAGFCPRPREFCFESEYYNNQNAKK